ncbi:trypsin-like peptidase domain-containing protein [Candidatus Saccharibacteria bacterium]|nr:trypsin-like peptidase domain-containing protein [Candidatus Saccharibacteria bacterium]
MKKENTTSRSTGKTAAAIFLCFIASFFGSWLFLATGIVKQDASQTINNNRENIVLQEGEVVAEVAKKVSPSVVSIVGQSGSNVSNGLISQQEIAGTGIIISENGYVVTNRHVLEGSSGKVSAILSDGTRYNNVKEVGEDPLNDIAFLRIEGAKDLTPVRLGDSRNVDIGQQVVAIGNALGQFKNTVTSGIISGIGRPIVAGSSEGQERLEGLFQTDAAINPGNSGGPLTNLAGEVIGINTAVAQDAEGIGFAIPINMIKGLVKGVVESGEIKRPYLGVQYISITPDVAEEFGLNVKRGAFVYNANSNSAVVSGGPAAKAGIRNRDIITKVNDTLVNERNNLAGLLSEFAPGGKINLTVLRDGQQRTLKVELGRLNQ